MKKYFLLSFFLVCSWLPCFAQTITTYAGSDTWGFSGDGGPATAAKLYYPWGLALTRNGDLIVADHKNNRIRKIDTAGIITTIAGTGAFGYSGDGGPATLAGLDTPKCVAIDTSGNIYVTTINLVRKINTAGIISTVAGVYGSSGYSGDGGPATNALLHRTGGLGTDRNGNLYIGDFNNYRVRKVDRAGIISTFAGNGTYGYSGDGGPATDAQMDYPDAIVVDTSGDLLISDGNNMVVRKVDPAGIIAAFAGDGVWSFSGDGGPATAAELRQPQQTAFDSAGNLFICDNGNARMRRVSAAGIITTVAGNGTPGSVGDGGPATACSFTGPIGVAVKDGCDQIVYISDPNAHRIRKITYFNSPPAFTNGHTYNMRFCPGEVTIVLDTMLTGRDSNVGQRETWSLIHSPSHGTVSVTYSATSNGGNIMPAGIVYNSPGGFTGTDTVSIAIHDCGVIADTAIFYITFLPPPNAGTISGPTKVCVGDSIVLTDAAPGGIWTISNAHATLASIAGGRKVKGTSPGIDTVSYRVSDTCGVATVSHVIVVKSCPDEVTSSSAPLVGVYPNPNNGLFTLSISNVMNAPAQITVTDITGRKVKELTVATNKDTEIFLSQPGMYFVTVTSETGRWYQKVIVQ